MKILKMNKIKEHIPMITTFVIILALLFYAYGCQPRTYSLIDHKKKVDRQQLLFEMDSLVNRYEAGIKDLDAQVKIRNIIFQQGLVIAQGGAINAPGLIITLLSVFGIGVTVDDVKNRKKLRNAIGENKTGNQD